MKTINLFLKFQFTSLSPDAQPVSLAVVSEDMKPCDFPEEYPSDKFVSFSDYKNRTFYAEFSDFDINRCDDWVKENVLSKLVNQPNEANMRSGNHEVRSDIETVKSYLKSWLSQFKDYQIQFVTDCGWFNWYWMVQLLDARETCPGVALIPTSVIPEDTTGEDFIKELRKTHGNVILRESEEEIKWVKGYQIGLPKLPSNISPVPEDLNDLIARSKGISVREAFELSREKLADCPYPNTGAEHNALYCAKVIKTIHDKFKSGLVHPNDIAEEGNTKPSKSPVMCNNIYNCAYLKEGMYPDHVCMYKLTPTPFGLGDSSIYIKPHAFCKGEFKTAIIANPTPFGSKCCRDYTSFCPNLKRSKIKTYGVPEYVCSQYKKVLELSRIGEVIPFENCTEEGAKNKLK